MPEDIETTGGQRQNSQNPSRNSDTPFNYNVYATKKSAAQSMMDVALLMANSFQLKTILSAGPKYNFYYPLIGLVGMSIALQVAVGLLLIFIAKSDIQDIQKQEKLNHRNNAATFLVFFSVIVNIFITALGFQNDSRSRYPRLKPSAAQLPKHRFSPS